MSTRTALSRSARTCSRARAPSSLAPPHPAPRSSLRAAKSHRCPCVSPASAPAPTATRSERPGLSRWRASSPSPPARTSTCSKSSKRAPVCSLWMPVPTALPSSWTARRSAPAPCARRGCPRAPTSSRCATLTTPRSTRWSTPAMAPRLRSAVDCPRRAARSQFAPEALPVRSRWLARCWARAARWSSRTSPAVATRSRSCAPEFKPAVARVVSPPQGRRTYKLAPVTEGERGNSALIELPPWYARWQVWTVAGVGVAAGVTATTLIILANQPEPIPDGDVTVSLP